MPWCQDATAAEGGPFEIGALLGPPSLPTDHNTTANWKRIRDCGIDTMFGAEDGSGYTKAVNETAIANAHRHRVKLLVVDPAIYGRMTLDAAAYHAWESVLPAYPADRRVQGFALRDEPPYVEFEGLASSYRRMKRANPRWQIFVNLAYAGGAHATDEPTPLVVSNAHAAEWGQYLEPGDRVGQTFGIPRGTARISDIELQLDPLQWPAGEVLTLTLWDSPLRAVRYGEVRLEHPGAKTLRFRFGAGVAVPRGMTAYFELTHSGHQKRAIGRLMRSLSDTYQGGAAYEQGVAQDYDLQFRVHAQRLNRGDGYENVIDDWVNLSGADHIHSTTVYPWRGGWDAADYFVALERLRGRALAHDLPFGLFLQSVKIVDARNGAITYRDPSPSMMRWNAYTALSYGAKRLYWFLYWPPTRVNGYSEQFFETPVAGDGSATAKYDTMCVLNQQLRGWNRVLGELTSQRVFHTGATVPDGARVLPPAFFVHPKDPTAGLVFGYFTGSRGQSYLMVVNRSYSQALPNLELAFENAPSSVAEITKRTGAQRNVPGYRAGILRLGPLEAGDGRLFVLNGGARPYSNLAALAKVSATSSLESTLEGYGLDKVHDDLRSSLPRNLGWSTEPVSSSDHSEAITFDLGGTNPVAAVDLYPLQQGHRFPKRYLIETSIDGRIWTKAAAETPVPARGHRINHVFKVRAARYVRITGTELQAMDGQYQMQIGEVEIYSNSKPPVPP